VETHTQYHAVEKLQGDNNKKKPKENKTLSWKYKQSVGSNGVYSKNIKGVTKEYKWYDGPGHGGKGIWVLHEPGASTNWNGPTCKTNDEQPAPVTEKKLKDTSIQALHTILEQAQSGNNISAALLAILN
jgi:hypothetical protein